MFGVPVSAGGLSRVRFSRTAEALALPRAPLFGFDGPGAAAAGPGHARAAASGVGCLPDAADAAPTRRGTNSAAGFRASVRRRRIERRRAAAAFGDGADDALAAAADALSRPIFISPTSLASAFSSPSSRDRVFFSSSSSSSSSSKAFAAAHFKHRISAFSFALSLGVLRWKEGSFTGRSVLLLALGAVVYFFAKAALVVILVEMGGSDFSLDYQNV